MWRDVVWLLPQFDEDVRSFREVPAAVQVKDYPGRVHSQPLVNLQLSALQLLESYHRHLPTLDRAASPSSVHINAPPARGKAPSQPTFRNQSLPLSMSFMRVMPSFIQLSALKFAEEHRDRSLILRLHNPMPSMVEVVVELALSAKAVYECRLDETRVGLLQEPVEKKQEGITTSVVRVELEAKKILTLEVVC